MAIKEDKSLYMQKLSDANHQISELKFERDELLDALQRLVNELPEDEVDLMRECIGRANASTIWRRVIVAKAVLSVVKEDFVS